MIKRFSHLKLFLLFIFTLHLMNCNNDDKEISGEIVVETGDYQNITNNSAELYGHIIDDGGLDILIRGAVWSSVTSEPTIENNEGYSDDGTGTGMFLSHITDLTEIKKYYIRSYASHTNGTTYGEVKFIYATELPFDYDGNIYNAVVIGNQEWMAENLRSTHYSDGRPLGRVNGSLNWTEMNKSDKAFCYYDNDPSNADIYGALYTWAAAMDIDKSPEQNTEYVQGVCPAGWHLPDDEEWKDLERYLGIAESELDKIDWRGTNEGAMLKEEGNDHWIYPNQGTNDFGFNALPGGFRNEGGLFFGLGEMGYWFTSTESEVDYTYDRWLKYDESRIFRSEFYWQVGISVRCIKD